MATHGHIAFAYLKQSLPNYGVFEEPYGEKEPSPQEAVDDPYLTYRQLERILYGKIKTNPGEA